MKTYATKKDIFRDFDLAIKFRLEHDVSPDRYEHFFDRLRRQEGWRIEEFSREVGHINQKYPISTGLFFEVPIEDHTGQPIGIEQVLLEHESGPEWFLLGAGAVAALFGKKLLSRAIDPVLDRLASALTGAMRDYWDVPIRYVEIRSLHKGVMRIKYEDFNPSQLTCLVIAFPDIQEIADVNVSCFGGQLFESDPNIIDDGI